MKKLTIKELDALASVIESEVNSELKIRKEIIHSDPKCLAEITEWTRESPEIIMLKKILRLLKEAEVINVQIRNAASTFNNTKRYGKYAPSNVSSEKQIEDVIESVLREYIAEKLNMPFLEAGSVSHYSLFHEMIAENTKCTISPCDFFDHFNKVVRRRCG
jgi:hypothetical protein